MYSGSVTEIAVLEKLISNGHICELLTDEEAKKWKAVVESKPNYNIDDLFEIAPDAEDLPFNGISCGKYLVLEVVSDYEGGSDGGPWSVDVWELGGVWLCASPEQDSLFFLKKEHAMSYCDDLVHDDVIEWKDHRE